MGGAGEEPDNVGEELRIYMEKISPLWLPMLFS